MSLLKKCFSCFCIVLMVVSGLIFSCAAAAKEGNALDKFYSYETPLLCVSRRGDTSVYPKNSLEAVLSAKEKGADFVSVSVCKTADGVFYLCEDESLGNICDAPYDNLSQMNSSEVTDYRLFNCFGEKTEYSFASLVKLLENTDESLGIILDIDYADRDEIFDVLKKHNSLERVIIRVNKSVSEVVKWTKTKDAKVYVICVYDGNIIFSSASFTNILTEAGMPAVQFSSKNYFNVAYGEFFTKRYMTENKVRAIATTYSPDLCGQRSDSVDGWNELIKKGYSVIETNNIESFVSYRSEALKLKKSISELLKRCPEDREKYSQISISNLSKAEKNCRDVLSSSFFSLDEAQHAYSDLIFCLQEMKVSDGEVDTRGALNITAGKVIASIFVGAALLAGQIYVFKMRKKNKK